MSGPRVSVAAVSLVACVLCATLGSSVVSAGCIPVRREWWVSLNTSATLPKMGERLTIDVLDENGRVACDDCTRTFEIRDPTNLGQLEKGTLAFGVAEPEDRSRTVRLRARLYRTRTADLSTAGLRAIDVVAKLPSFVTAGALEVEKNLITVNFPLPLSCSGRPPDLEKGTTCQLVQDPDLRTIDGPEPTLSKDSPILLPYGDEATCSKPVPEGMTCAGAGAFLQGHDSYEALVFDYPTTPTVPMVVLPEAALMLDTDEVTVGTVRKLLQEKKVVYDLKGPGGLQVRGAPGATDGTDACTFIGRDDAKNDALPINCIGRDLASDVCRVLGRRLPKEYEWEFAAGNGSKETIYPWGDIEGARSGLFNYDLNQTVCARAIVGRGRANVRGESRTCSTAQTGPVAGGAAATDVTASGLRNMGGNVGEWVADELGFYDEPCWAPLNEGCGTTSSRLNRRFLPYRGGSWARDPQSTVAVARFGQENGEPSPYIGFRCAITEDELP